MPHSLLKEINQFWADFLIGVCVVVDLNYEKLVAEAAARWFRPNEIYAILANHARFKIHAQPVDKPVSMCSCTPLDPHVPAMVFSLMVWCELKGAEHRGTLIGKVLRV